MIPIYFLFLNLNLLDSYLALVLTYAAANLPIVVWLLRDFFNGIPLELDESALVDGANRFQVFYKIILPLSVPGLVATFIFTLVFAWNEYIFALFISRGGTQTLPLLVAAQQNTRGTQWWDLSVLVLIMILPVILIAILLERVHRKRVAHRRNQRIIPFVVGPPPLRCAALLTDWHPRMHGRPARTFLRQCQFRILIKKVYLIAVKYQGDFLA